MHHQQQRIILTKLIPKPTKPPLPHNDTTSTSNKNSQPHEDKYHPPDDFSDNDDDLNLEDINQHLNGTTPKRDSNHAKTQNQNSKRRTKRKRKANNIINNEQQMAQPRPQLHITSQESTNTNHPPIKRRKVTMPKAPSNEQYKNTNQL